MSRHFYHRSPNIITGMTLPTATQGTAYTTPFQGANGVTPYRWAVTAASPDAGSQVPIGALSGNSLTFTPTNAGVETITVQITDALGNMRIKQFLLNIRASSPAPTVKALNPGHGMQPRSLDQSGPGAQNYKDIGLAISTNTQLVTAGKPTLKRINLVYSWAYLESAQGVYTFSKTVDQDVLQALNSDPDIIVDIWIRTFGNQGTNAITQSGTSSNTAFSALNKGILPNYLLQPPSGRLRSTDNSMYTTSAPVAPNPNERGWSMSQWGGSGYSYLVGANWWHPVYSQCFLNTKQALACHVVPDGSGLTYDQHLRIGRIGSWDEESVNFGWGGTWSNRPPDDPNVFVGATGPFIGGTPFSSADSTTVASCTALQINAAIEQNLCGSKLPPPQPFTASDPGATPSTWTVNGGFAKTSVSSCLSFLMSGNIVGSGNGFVTIAQLRQHMVNLFAGGVEFGNADLFGAEYSQDAAGVPWNYGNTAVTIAGNLSGATSTNLSSGAWPNNTGQIWTALNGIGRPINYTQGSIAINWAGALTLSGPITGTAYNTHNHPSNGILVGGVYADEAFETPGAYIPPLAGPSSALATAHSPPITGTDYRGLIQIIAYIEGLDYGTKMGAGAAAYTQAAVAGVFRAAQFEWASCVYWQNCSNRFQPFPDEWNGTNPSFPAFILPAIMAMPPFTAQQNLQILQGVSFLTPTILSAGANGGVYLAQLSVSGNTGAVGYILNSNSGTTLVRVTQEGWIIAAPKVNETCNLSITATDSLGRFATHTFTVTFSGTLQLTNIQRVPDAPVGVPYSHALALSVYGAIVAGGTHPYTLGATGLPTGIAMDGAGNLSGTPSGTGLSTVTLTCTDGNGVGVDDTVAFTINVVAASKATRPAANTGSGFFVSGSKLYDPLGNEFRIRGTNRFNWNSSASGPSGSPANTFRVIIDPTQPVANNVSLLQSIHMANFQVPIPVSSTGTLGSTAVGVLNTVVAAWVAQAPTWLQLDSAMILNIADGWGAASSSAWRDAYISAIASLRAAGYTCPLLIDTGNGGQDPADIVTYAAAVLASDLIGNVLFGFHLYGATTNIASTLASLAAVGVCVVIDEFGPPNVGSSPPAGDASTVITACETNNLGWIAVAWDDGPAVGNDSGDSMTFNGPGTFGVPSDMTRWGLEIAHHPTYGQAALAQKASHFILQFTLPTNSPLLYAAQGVPYMVDYGLIGGKPPYTVTKVSGPAEYTVPDPTVAVISGIPASTGTPNIVIQATDAAGGSVLFP